MERRASIAVGLVLAACGAAPPPSEPAHPARAAFVCPDAPAAPAVDASARHLRFELTRLPVGPIGLDHAASVWTGREHLIFGGEHPGLPGAPRSRASSGVWVESPAGSPWTTIGWALDPHAATWRELPGAPIPGSSPRDSVAWLCGRALVLTRTGEAWLYDPESGERTQASSDGAPTGCQGHPIHVEGSRATVFGCDDCDGHVYDAASDAWTNTGALGDRVAWTMGRCGSMYTALVDGALVVVRNYQDNAGARWDPSTRAWTALAEEGAPELVLAGPIGEHGVFGLVGQRAAVARIYHYDLAAGAWSDVPLENGVACMGQRSTRVGHFLVEAGAWMAGAPICAYDLTRSTPAGALTNGWSDPAAAVSFGDDHALFWGGPRGTDEGDGEMPLLPTRWIENDVRIVRWIAE